MDKLFAIFGSGTTGKIVFESLDAAYVYCFIDNYKSGQYLGKDITNIENLLEIDEDICIIVASYDFAEEICQQLISLGISDYYVWTREHAYTQLMRLQEMLPQAANVAKMRQDKHFTLLVDQFDSINKQLHTLNDQLSYMNHKLEAIEQGGIAGNNRRRFERDLRFENPLYLDRYGYKVYSQNDEDGIIAEIFKRIGTTNKVFVEFGVQNGLESNTHYLLFQGWKGLWIEGNKRDCEEISKLFIRPLSSEQLTVRNAFITRSNINELILESGISGEIDILSIDIDGNDYWIFEMIDCIQPRVVVIEYNPKFPPPCEWIMPYCAEHVWNGSDNYGASLKSFEVLGNTKGYRLVGTNTINAFFVKSELTNGLFPEPATAENLYSGYWGHRTVEYIG